MSALSAAGIFLVASLQFLAADPQPAPKPAPREAGKVASPGEAPGPDRPKADPAARDPSAAAPAAPAPVLKTAEAGAKFQEGMAKFKAGDYAGARTILTACLKDGATAADKKIIQGLIDDTKLGAEIEAARKLVDAKNEKKAIAKLEAAVKANPKGSLVPAAEKLIRETEELVYCMLDDFEPGEALETETANRNPDGEEKRFPGFSSSRWQNSMSFNSDPHYVFHGKGSMKWAASGSAARRGPPGPGGGFQGYRSPALKTAIPRTRWRTLVFHVFLPEAEEGTLRVTLAPTADADVSECLFSEKLIDLRGKRGWLPVRLDLVRDFGGTRNLKLDDVKFIRIEYIHVHRRTIYLDFVHLE